MIFEELIQLHLTSCDKLTDRLAVYNNVPAVFNQKAPPDDDILWENGVQYSRAIFYAVMQRDKERETSGVLTVDIHCRDSETDFEGLGQILRDRLDGYLFTSNQNTIAVKWSDTKYFPFPDKNITVISLLFELLAFPCQESSEPDPVRLINSWTKTLLPSAKILGSEDIEPIFKPTRERPVIYWRLFSSAPWAKMPPTSAGCWYLAVMYCHVLAQDTAAQNKIAMDICQALNVQKVLKFSNGTAMRIDWNNKLSFGTDELRTGQLYTEGTYCYLTPIEPSEKLKYINIRTKGVSENG